MAMYNYNNLLLPPLPHYDKEKYPYAWIDTNHFDPYLVLSSSPLYIAVIDDVKCYAFDASADVKVYTVNSDKWILTSKVAIELYHDGGSILYVSAVA